MFTRVTVEDDYKSKMQHGAEIVVMEGSSAREASRSIHQWRGQQSPCR